MAIAIARVEDAVPVIAGGFIGGMAQSWLVRKYPQWSWLLSIALIGGGAYLSARGGTMGNVALGVATAGAAGLGMALMPVGTTRQVGGQSLAGRMLSGMGQGVGSFPGPIRAPEFDNVRIS
jgi:hypothetical protein